MALGALPSFSSTSETFVLFDFPEILDFMEITLKDRSSIVSLFAPVHSADASDLPSSSSTSGLINFLDLLDHPKDEDLLGGLGDNVQEMQEIYRV